MQTNTAPAVLRAFSQHCSEVTAQVKRQEETCLPIGASGELLGQTQAPPCSRLCPQGCDSLTKQLGSVVTPSQLGKKKVYSSHQPNPFASPVPGPQPSGKKRQDTVFHSPTRPEGSSSGRRLALGMFSWKFCQLKGCCASPSSQEEAGEISTP